MNRDVDSEAKNTKRNGIRATDEEAPQGERLEALVTFVKANWKTVLTDLVTAGVNAYLVHNTNKKEKTAGDKGRTIASH
jgi:hypothetical protein